jgi:hypothetical protein
LDPVASAAKSAFPFEAAACGERTNKLYSESFDLRPIDTRLRRSMSR